MILLTTHKVLPQSSRPSISPSTSALMNQYPSVLTPFSSKLYMTFSHCLLLSRGHTLYSGPGRLTPVENLAARGMERCPEGYNVADWLLEVASGPESTGMATAYSENSHQIGLERREGTQTNLTGDGEKNSREELVVGLKGEAVVRGIGGRYATTFLTQFEILAGREWKILKRYCHTSCCI